MHKKVLVRSNVPSINMYINISENRIRQLRVKMFLQPGIYADTPNRCSQEEEAGRSPDRIQ